MIKSTLLNIAIQQLGYFTAKQAVASGYAQYHHSYHVRNKDWMLVDRGVYRLPGYPDTLESDFIRWSFWAIGRSPNRQVVVSHDSALFYYNLTSERPADVHLTVPVKLFKKEEKPGCVFHREEFNPEDMISHTGYKITTPARTLQDMKPMLLLTSTWADTVRLAQDNNLIDQEIARNLLGDLLFQQAGSGHAWARPAAQGVLRVGHSGELCAAGTLQSNQRKTEMRDYGVRMGTGRYSEWRTAGRSFTLVEMLVVISIICILSSMLMPSLQAARQASLGTNCRNNLRQIHYGSVAYSDDFHGFFEAKACSSGTWFQTGYFGGPYLGITWKPISDFYQKTVIDCPSQDSGFMGYAIDYAGNQCLGRVAADNRSIPKIVNVKSPGKLIMYADGAGQVGADPGTYVFEAWLRDYLTAFDFRHNGSVNILCADGHAATTHFGGISFLGSNTEYNTRQ